MLIGRVWVEKGVGVESLSLKLGCSLYTLHHRRVNLNDLAAQLFEKAIHLSQWMDYFRKCFLAYILWISNKTLQKYLTFQSEYTYNPIVLSRLAALLNFLEVDWHSALSSHWLKHGNRCQKLITSFAIYLPSWQAQRRGTDRPKVVTIVCDSCVTLFILIT